MLSCFNKTLKKIEAFQEECSSTIFALRHLLGEDVLLKDNDLILKEEEGGLSVYKGTERIMVSGDMGIFVESKYVKNIKLIKEAQDLLKESEQGGGTAAQVDGQQLGGRSKEQLKKKLNENSVADVAVAPKRMTENQSSDNVDANQDENPNVLLAKKYAKQAKMAAKKKKIDESEGETDVIGATPKKAGETVKLAVQKAKFDSKKITGFGNNKNVVGTIKP